MVPALSLAAALLARLSRPEYAEYEGVLLPAGGSVVPLLLAVCSCAVLLIVAVVRLSRTRRKDPVGTARVQRFFFDAESTSRARWN